MKPEQRVAQTNEQAFTLVEIIVVVAILAVMTSILVTGLVNYAVKQRFDSVVGDVRDGVVKVRQDTLGSVRDSQYGVHVSSTAVVFFEGSSFIDGAGSNITIDLPSSVIATPVFSNGLQHATFTRLTGLPSATGTISFFDTTQNRQATITISTTGLVK